MVRLLLEQAEGIDAVALERARRQIVVRHLRELERPGRLLESAVLDLFALGRVRSRAETLQALQQVSSAQVRDGFAAMLQAGASVAVAGKLGRGLEPRLREWAAPLLRGAMPAPAPSRR